ncbi:hypothetical protein M2475_001620 [Breznakia sp. PF5-3]|uniref:hypothetical protein n=1 Tax=unclassified Breznakia TaxID=2623764 RepID=UPI002406C2F9|nr:MULTISPECIES: hypothetical protein [unclassified Breznakia]MDF9825186.1 hypothetical protein [Breznakia sp. PM6-1]MDF9836044.1 hypothetical protein [Breznakia sp. PF5-3]MDF9838595.1 hypothetical protein [Breznakia sp. PFB2-8]MDF9860636.1 hypothetical protein [Breznakia sp. PH5-24]
MKDKKRISVSLECKERKEEVDIIMQIACKEYIEMKSKYPKLSMFWMFAFFRENQASLCNLFQDIYTRYEHTRFSVQKLNLEDIAYIEGQFLKKGSLQKNCKGVK